VTGQTWLAGNSLPNYQKSAAVRFQKAAAHGFKEVKDESAPTNRRERYLRFGEPDASTGLSRNSTGPHHCERPASLVKKRRLRPKD
jgi:hypothetical protein